jgi:small-conductance mechanosensitive channel
LRRDAPGGTVAVSGQPEEGGMHAMFSGTAIVAWLQSLWAWLLADVLTGTNVVYTAMQIPAVVGTGVAAWWVHDFVHPVLEQRIRQLEASDYVHHVLATAASLVLPALWTLGLWVSTVVAASFAWPHNVVWMALNLVAAWIVVQLASMLVRDPVWSRLIAGVAYAAATLNILQILEPTLALLDRLAITLGDFRLSLLTVLRGMIALGVLLWVAVLTSKMLERRVHELPNLTPTVQVLIGKLLKTTLIALAVVLALTSVGLDLTALALFGGGLGLGIGFGLQKLVSNMISGIFLLLDRSIKPGDVIQVGGTYGWVSSLGARYVSVETRDGTEYLIPNEDIITQQVVSWSHQNDLARLKVQVQVPFESDLEQALALMLEAAAKPSRVLKQPTPRALLLDFRDGRAELELRFWIRDAHNGVRNISGEVRLEIWRMFRAHGLTLSAPMRDISITGLSGSQGSGARAGAPALVSDPAAT